MEQSAQEKDPEVWNQQTAICAQPWVCLAETAQTLLEELVDAVQSYTDASQDMKEQGMQHQQWDGHGCLCTSDAEIAKVHDVALIQQLLKDFADFQVE